MTKATVEWLAALAKGGMRHHEFTLKVPQSQFGEWLLESRDDGRYSSAYGGAVMIYGPHGLSVRVVPS